jgi:hypothetical protein
MRRQRSRPDLRSVVLSVRRAEVGVREDQGVGGVKGGRFSQVDLERDGLGLLRLTTDVDTSPVRGS